MRCAQVRAHMADAQATRSSFRSAGRGLNELMSIGDESRFEELKASGLLPSPKGVALAVMQLAQDESATTAAMARTIKADPALSGRMVKAANTAQFGGRRPVASVPDAIVVLGINTVRQLALGFSLVSDYRNGKCSAFDYDRFWSRSLIKALAMQAIASRVRTTDPEETFLIGLLSDIGRLALATVYPQQYAQVLTDHGEGPPAQLIRLEQQCFVTDHKQLTAALMSDWGLPKVLIEPTLYQDEPGRSHHPSGSRGYLLVYSLHLAGVLADLCLAPEPNRRAKLPDLFVLGTRMGLDAERITAIADQTVQDWQEWGRLLEVPAHPVRSFAELSKQSAADDAAPAETADKLRVLLVEDDAATLLMLEKLLDDAGYRVFTAADGKQGLHAAMECRPHIIVVDWLMPEMDGLQFCRALRNSKIGRAVYLVMLTGVEEESRMLQAFEAGVDNYVTKPLNPRLLLAQLRAGERVVSLQTEAESDREEIQRVAAGLAMNNRRLQEAALLDPLTGIPNRRYAMDRIHQEWSAAERSARPLSCMLIDVDHFKSINDTHGHDVGDLVLRRVSEVLKHTARAPDVICRIGGEEFLVVCPDTDAAAAAQCAERLRQATGNMRIPIGNVSLQVTISIGVAARDSTMHTPESLIKAADQAVYAAKHAGRNRTMVFRPRPPEVRKGSAVSA
ncbi:MAG: diguanylate cyclase [Betaproteobacteria bacterium]|nr:MAG: diguanylate cyclase [Betaproteobacteria bacterium]